MAGLLMRSWRRPPLSDWPDYNAATWQVRVAMPEDLPFIMRVMEAAFDPQYGEAWTTAQALSLFALPGYTVLVGYGDDMVVDGFAAFRCTGMESELMLLAVIPQVRGKGLGRNLLQQWLALGASKGCDDFFLEMRVNNDARRLYADMGFAECGHRRDYYRASDGGKIDAVTMKRSL